MIQSRDAYGYVFLHTLRLQCYCDLYRFLTPGVREAVSRKAFQSTPPEYITYCQRQCLARAIELCEFWSDVYHIRRDIPMDDLLFGVCIYQVSQVLSHLPHLLNADDTPGQVEELQRKLNETLNVCLESLCGRFSRMEDCLREAEIGRAHV